MERILWEIGRSFNQNPANQFKLNNLNFHPLEVVSQYRDPQLKWLKIAHACWIRDKAFANIDVEPFKPSRCIKASFYIPET